MLRYHLENGEHNKWKLMLTEMEQAVNPPTFDGIEVEVMPHPEDMNKILQAFYDQICLDVGRLEAGEEVSDCAYNTPRLGSALDKKTRFAKELAFKLFPMAKKGMPGVSDEEAEKDEDVKKVWSYVRFSQLTSKLTKKFKEQLEAEEEERQAYRKARLNGQRHLCCLLKNKPPTEAVTRPTPMPVEVPPLEELEPFFKYLSSNIEVIDKDHVEFQRGAHYRDRRIDLCKQVVGSPWIGNLMDSIKENPFVDHFLLGNNVVGREGAKAISDFMKGDHVPKIQTWYLAGNEIDSEGVKMIVEALKTDTVADALWLKRNPLLPEGGKAIAELVKVNQTLEILDLHNTGILDEGAIPVIRALRENTGLRHLYLDANGLTAETAEELAQYFEWLVAEGRVGITSLWVDINRIGDSGAISLARGLKNYLHLERLVVGSDRITAVGVKALCDALVDHPKLRVFDMGFYKSTSDMGELPNSMGNEGARHVANFIRRNQSVQVLSVLHNNIERSGLEEILAAFKENGTLLYIYFEQYGLKVESDLRKAFIDQMKLNIQSQTGLEYGEFVREHLQYLKHSEKVKNIDSIYRNKM